MDWWYYTRSLVVHWPEVLCISLQRDEDHVCVETEKRADWAVLLSFLPDESGLCDDGAGKKSKLSFCLGGLAA
jgi:hypothetical protein